MSEEEPRRCKGLTRIQVATLTKVNSLVERVEKELFLMASLNSVTYEDIKVWVMNSGTSHHMTRMISVFLTFSEIDTNFYV
jgi:hypothetical protein